jgi:acetyl esterase/lipase
MKRSWFVFSLFATLIMARAQPVNTFPLWPDGAPATLGNASNDIPTLTVFLPDPANATGAAMVICPGGAYAGLAAHEGADYARWLNEAGVAAFVLKYHLGSAGYHHPAMQLDAARALRTVRTRSKEWLVDPKRIGIMGSSAGGHLAATLLTHFDPGIADAADPIDRASSRPDLGVLCYPVITLGEFTHQGSKDNLLGKNPSPELVQSLSNELQVTKETPPCFVWTTEEDRTVPMENSMLFVAALRKNHVPFDFHVYQKGGHGMGLGSHNWNPDKRHPWTRDCLYWLKAQGFVN